MTQNHSNMSNHKCVGGHSGSQISENGPKDKEKTKDGYDLGLKLNSKTRDRESVISTSYFPFTCLSYLDWFSTSSAELKVSKRVQSHSANIWNYATETLQSLLLSFAQVIGQKVGLIIKDARGIKRTQ